MAAVDMKIVTAVRCLNEIENLEKFITGYEFSDMILISDGGSTDGSVGYIKQHPLYGSKIKLIYFNHHVMIDGYYFNEDAPHMNYVLDWAKELKPDWLIFDDLDCYPNLSLRLSARELLENCANPQINAFRLYLWGDTGKYFPHMNRDFNPLYTSLWAWRPSEINIRADESIRHGTLTGVDNNPHRLETPYCLLHKSYSPENIDAKLRRYNALGLTMLHPLETNGELQDLPEWATE